MHLLDIFAVSIGELKSEPRGWVRPARLACRSVSLLPLEQEAAAELELAGGLRVLQLEELCVG